MNDLGEDLSLRLKECMSYVTIAQGSVSDLKSVYNFTEKEKMCPLLFLCK